MSNAITSSANAIVHYLLVASVTAAVLTPLAWEIAKVVKVRAPVYRQLLWLYCLIGIAVLPVVWLYGPKLTLAILPAEVEQLEAVNALEVDSTHKPGLVESPSDESYLLKPTDVEMSAPTNVEEGQPFPTNIVLAALWLTGTILMLVRLCVGWYRLRRICLSATPLSQDNRFGNMDGRKLKILVTSQIKGPVCFGVLRPIIMLPRRMYENGTAEELRMIISHELAHIERRDCWANLYQRLVEAVFFFHPLVWCASSRLTQEREQICDNYVLAQGSSVTDYTALLAQIGEQGLVRTQLRTVALFEGRLLQRVRNLLDPRLSRKTKPSRWATMVCTVAILICFGMLGTVRLAAKPTVDSLSAPVESEASAEEKGNLNIFDIKFEPIHQGKNVVKVNIQNTSNKEQTFAIHIYTRSVDYAPGGVGWGTRFFDTIKAKETKWSRFVFKIQGPVTDNTWLRLKFYNPESEEAYDYEKPFQQRRYESSDLERREVTTEKSKPPHYPETDNVITAFRQIQDYIRTRKYEEAWQLFTKDYKEAEFQTRGLEAFKKAMEPTHPLHSAFVWEKDDFLNLEPTKHITKKDNVLTLHAKSEKQHWKIDFVREESEWKIDWIAGYRPAILDTIEADAAKGPAASNPQSDINAKVAQLDIDTATFDDVIRIFGEPEKYLWGNKTFSKNNLPDRYIMLYPNRFQVVMAAGRINELRHHEPGYVFRDKLRVGYSLEQVLEVIGRPTETVEGKQNKFKDGVLYKNIDGRKGYCYYSRADQDVRIFFANYKVTALYVTRSDYGTGGSFQTVRPITSVKEFDDVRWKNMSKLDLSGRKSLIITLTFNRKTVWPASAKMPPGCDPNKVLTEAMNPGLGVRELHEQGITGKGVNLAIIDQPLYLDHPEFAGKIVAYHDVGCGSQSSMHGPAVASLLVGTNCGTAPDARVYYVAAPSWKKDAAYYAEALDWIIEQNEKLSASEKIRVVSVSAAPSGRGSLFEKHNKMWDKACRRAEAAGILVLDCTSHHGFIGPCWYNTGTPESVARCTPGFPGKQGLWARPESILVPSSPRTTAEEYDKGDFSYQYCGRGGLSWAIPYCAGVLALGWQVNPDLGPEQMRNLLFKSAYIKKSGAKIINPKRFVRLVRKAKVTPRTSRSR